MRSVIQGLINFIAMFFISYYVISAISMIITKTRDKKKKARRKAEFDFKELNRKQDFNNRKILVFENLLSLERFLIYSDVYSEKKRREIISSFHNAIISASTSQQLNEIDYNISMAHSYAKEEESRNRFYYSMHYGKPNNDTEEYTYSTHFNKRQFNNPVNTPEVIKNLKALNLDASVTNFAIVKNRYYKLLKEYHPDVSNNPNAEEITKNINIAYSYLKEAMN